MSSFLGKKCDWPKSRTGTGDQKQGLVIDCAVDSIGGFLLHRYCSGQTGGQMSTGVSIPMLCYTQHLTFLLYRCTEHTGVA